MKVTEGNGWLFPFQSGSRNHAFIWNIIVQRLDCNLCHQGYILIDRGDGQDCIVGAGRIVIPDQLNCFRNRDSLFDTLAFKEPAMSSLEQNTPSFLPAYFVVI